MKKLIEDFPYHIQEAVENSKSIQVSQPKHPIHNVVIIGLGGSGIGASMVHTLTESIATAPIQVYKSYQIPAYVSKNTLFIASSFSGNTEETLACLHDAATSGAHIACITSGGKILQMAETYHLDKVILPVKEECPRAHLAFSVIALIELLRQYHILPEDLKWNEELLHCADLLLENQEDIISEARDWARKMHGLLPILYSGNLHYPVLIRFCQQINENSKHYCHTNVFPEMNHNELVGWVHPQEIFDRSIVFMFDSEKEHERIRKRMQICKPIFEQKAAQVYTINFKGNTLIEEYFHAIHLTDWISYFLAVLNHEDPFPVDIIKTLKSQLANSGLL